MDELVVAAMLGENEELYVTLLAAELANSLRDAIPTSAITFDLRTKSDGMSLHRFRFKADGIMQIHVALRLLDVVYTKQRVSMHSLEAFCILLSRLAYPCRWFDAMEWFGRSPPVLCSAFMVCVKMLYTKVEARMKFDHRMIDMFGTACAEQVHAKTQYLTRCIGFVDGTVRPVCRPSRYQRQAHNGHKRVHAVKYQVVALANGLIVSLTDANEGRRHDGALLKLSGFGERMKESFPEFYVYGDPAYPVKK